MGETCKRGPSKDALTRQAYHLRIIKLRASPPQRSIRAEKFFLPAVVLKKEHSN
jgi:hypothetical protein